MNDYLPSIECYRDDPLKETLYVGSSPTRWNFCYLKNVGDHSVVDNSRSFRFPGGEILDMVKDRMFSARVRRY